MSANLARLENGLDLSLMSNDWPIDMEGVRSRVIQLLNLMQERLVPLSIAYIEAEKRGDYQKRRESFREVDHLIHHEIGVAAPKDLDLDPGSPCLLVWNYALSRANSQIEPIYLELARVTGVKNKDSGDLEVFAAPLAQITFTDPPVLERHDPRLYWRRPRKIVIYGNSDVVVPLI